jgi:SNF2 family DNA or RNA helicase
MPTDFHKFAPGKNEVAYLEDRLKGLVVVKHKKDCLDLPDKQYRIVTCEPNQTTLRVAKSLFDTAPSVITGLTALRELSDGFQYREKVDGTTKCPVCEDGTTEVWQDPEEEDKIFEMIDMLDDEYIETLEKITVTCPTCNGKQEVPRKVRVTREVPTPKEAALVDLLEENDEQGRIVIFAGFTGSLDRIIKTCQKEGWSTVRCDGAGWRVEDRDGKKLSGKTDPMEYWADTEQNTKVAFVAHPQSGGLSLTLTEARMSVFWSNDFNPESRSQAEDRIHRIGMDENKGATIVDLIHLPTDLNIRTVLKDNRRLELLSMGDIESVLG